MAVEQKVRPLATGKDRFRELSEQEGWVLLDAEAQRYLQMSAVDFVQKWDAGELRDRDHSDLMRVAMLLPFVR